MIFQKAGGVSWIVVFLGNPGKKYDGTRHNVGFQTADTLEKRAQLKIAKLRFNALTATAELGGQKVLLMKPQTFMNLSGNAVAPAAAYYKVPADHVVVIQDDMALPAGKLRIRAKGSAGGHNGLKSIIAALGTDAFPRIKIGVGVPPSDAGEEDIINWVLGSFSGKEAGDVAEACSRACDALPVLISEGAEKAMNDFN
jgi:PTH1 family peptidyl-tRNA hydrolase